MTSALGRPADDKLKIYETVLSSPGMNEKCKISLQLSRQHILLLSRIIESGLSPDKKETEDDIIGFLPKESLEELRLIMDEILRKGGLTEFYEKLKSL